MNQVIVMKKFKIFVLIILPLLITLTCTVVKADPIAMNAAECAVNYELELIAEAVISCRTSASQGHVVGQSHLGLLYYRGMGVAQDYKTAARWLKLAAEQGDTLSQLVLGTMYLVGSGVIEDFVIAHMWLNIAGSNGEPVALENRDIAARSMTREQIAEAHNMARRCIEKNYKNCY